MSGFLGCLKGVTGLGGWPGGYDGEHLVVPARRPTRGWAPGGRVRRAHRVQGRTARFAGAGGVFAGVSCVDAGMLPLARSGGGSRPVAAGALRSVVLRVRRVRHRVVAVRPAPGRPPAAGDRSQRILRAPARWPAPGWPCAGGVPAAQRPWRGGPHPAPPRGAAVPTGPGPASSMAGGRWLRPSSSTPAAGDGAQQPGCAGRGARWWPRPGSRSGGRRVPGPARALVSGCRSAGVCGWGRGDPGRWAAGWRAARGLSFLRGEGRHAVLVDVVLVDGNRTVQGCRVQRLTGPAAGAVRAGVHRAAAERLVPDARSRRPVMAGAGGLLGRFQLGGQVRVGAWSGVFRDDPGRQGRPVRAGPVALGWFDQGWLVVASCSGRCGPRRRPDWCRWRRTRLSV
jgi:hypothetical protein